MAEKANGWLWFALAGAGALVAFLYFRSAPMPQADAAPVYDKAAETRERWAQFCAGFPCEELPMGFSTVDAFGKRFYVPLPATIEAKTGISAEGMIPSVRGLYADISPSAVGTVEIDDYRRTYEGREPNLHIGYCCEALLTYYGLVGPDYTDGMSSDFLNWPSIGLRNANEVYAYDKTYLSTQVYQRSDAPDKDMTPENLPEGLLTPFSTDFNHLNVDMYESFIVISKQPMVDGRYIAGECRTIGRCEFHALRKPTDPIETDFPLYHTGLMVFHSVPTECSRDMEEGQITCPEIDVEFSKMAQLIRTTAQMLDLMLEPPIQLQGAP